MAKKTTRASRKKAAETKKAPVSKKTPTPWWRLDIWLVRLYAWVVVQSKDIRSRRPHRSFQLTRRRDYQRTLNIPGYWEFSFSVWRVLMRHKQVFIPVVVIYSVLLIVLGTVTDQAVYSQIYTFVTQSSEEIIEGNLATLAQASILSVSVFFGFGLDSMTDGQRIMIAVITFMLWLNVVWLVRQISRGEKPHLRQSLYMSSAPFLSTFMVSLVLAIQLLPAGFLAIIYSALSRIYLVNEGFGAMLFAFIAILVVSLVLYWATATFIALVVVTLPGMYPLNALKIAGDMVVGRRLRILLRIIWMAVGGFLMWFVLLIPLILLTGWLGEQFEWVTNVPIVPMVSLLLSAVLLMYFAAYIYLLYRKIVEDEDPPVKG